LTYEIKCTIPVTPQPKRRVRAASHGGRVVTYKDRSTKLFERSVALYLRQYAPLQPLEGPVRFRIDFIHPRPRRLLQRTKSGQPVAPGLHWKPTTPDLSNLCKAIEDAAQVAGIIHNDSQIAELHALDFYSERDQEPRIVLTISELPEWGGARED